MHTEPTALLLALRKAHAEIKEYRAELALVPDTELPEDWDAVVMQEWLGEMAHTIASDSACLTNLDGSVVRFGIDSTAGFLASFWETHHMLAHALKDYPKAVRTFFGWAEDTLAKAIEDHTPNA